MKRKAIELLLILKKILFIVPYPIGVAPSQRFRFEQYFDVLRKHDFEFTVASFWSAKGWSILYQRKHVWKKILLFLLGCIHRFLLLFKIHSYHIIFLHREALPLGPPVFEFIVTKILKKQIVYDFDDAIWLPNTSAQNSMVRKLKYHQKVGSICKWSRKVSCGNEFLVNYAKTHNDNVYLNPTTIDTTYHQPKIKTSHPHNVIIGWTGTHSTTKYLNHLVPVLTELKNKYPIQIMIISNQKPDWEIDDYKFISWNKAHEIRQLDQIDIGIMPLEDTLWEQGKCGFKALQYMAMEKPAVVSNVGVNKIIIDHTVDGYLCNTLEDWQTYLTELILSDTKRKLLGANGRKKVKQAYSVASNTSLFLSLFE